jgi:hypothetical protein
MSEYGEDSCFRREAALTRFQAALVMESLVRITLVQGTKTAQPREPPSLSHLSYTFTRRFFYIPILSVLLTPTTFYFYAHPSTPNGLLFVLL